MTQNLRTCRDVASLSDRQASEAVDQREGANPASISNFWVPRDPAVRVVFVDGNTVVRDKLLVQASLPEFIIAATDDVATAG